MTQLGEIGTGRTPPINYGGGSGGSVIEQPIAVNTPPEVIQQQFNIARAMAGIDPNLIRGPSPAILAAQRQKELVEQRRLAMIRLEELNRNRRRQ